MRQNNQHTFYSYSIYLMFAGIHLISKILKVYSWWHCEMWEASRCVAYVLFAVWSEQDIFQFKKHWWNNSRTNPGCSKNQMKNTTKDLETLLYCCCCCSIFVAYVFVCFMIFMLYSKYFVALVFNSSPPVSHICDRVRVMARCLVSNCKYTWWLIFSKWYWY